ncbi:MAG TPA: CHASE sensor domain-containing protein, partial [Arenimonas sp.]|nr:CHASE sensor domain-containing protein [Arenimonas sp.]
MSLSVLAASMIAVFLFCLALLSAEVVADRSKEEKHVQDIARIMALNVAPATFFDDEKMAKEYLLNVMAYPDIVNARVYRKDGSVLSEVTWEKDSLVSPAQAANRSKAYEQADKLV